MRGRVFLMGVSLLAGACAAGQALRAYPVPEPGEVKGTYTVILYRGLHLQDLETAAFLDLEGDGYELAPRAPEFDFKALKGLGAKEALGEALHHASSDVNVTGTRMRRITGEAGSTIGYEIRPLYQPFAYGESDVIDINYWLMEGGKVRVVVELKDRVRRKIDDKGEGFIWGD